MHRYCGLQPLALHCSLPATCNLLHALM